MSEHALQTTRCASVHTRDHKIATDFTDFAHLFRKRENEATHTTNKDPFDFKR